MDDNHEYTVAELLEQAENDPNWEPDAEKRETLVRQLKGLIAGV